MKKAILICISTLFLLALSSCEDAEAIAPNESNMLSSGITVINERQHSMIIDSQGNLWAWGNNQQGQLGDGTFTCHTIPVVIMDNVASVHHYCGQYVTLTPLSILGVPVYPPFEGINMRTFAITKDGNLYGWGTNDNGQLGNGTTQDSNLPIRIMDNIASVYPSFYNTFAITMDGNLYAWGRNGEYRPPSFFTDGGYINALGDGTLYKRLTPVRIMDGVASVHTGRLDRTSFLITTDGSLYGWGSNARGAIGDGTTNHSLVPIRVMDNVAKVFNDGAFSIFALTTDGGLYVWGDYHEENDAHDDYRKYPTRFMDNVIYFDQHNLLVILEDNSVWSLATCPTYRISFNKIRDNIRFIATSERGLLAYRVYAISINGDLLTWLQPFNERYIPDEYDQNYIPTVVLHNVVSVYPGSRWRISEITDDEEILKALDELQEELPSGTDMLEWAFLLMQWEYTTGMTLPINANTGSYALTADGKLWRIGNHEPFVVLEAVVGFSSSEAGINIALTADGSVWAWRDIHGFLYENDATPDRPTMILLVD